MKLKKKQNPPPKDVDDTMNLKPFSKPSDEVQTPLEEVLSSPSLIDQSDKRKKGDECVDKPKMRSTSPTEIKKYDDQEALRKPKSRTGTYSFFKHFCHCRKACLFF